MGSLSSARWALCRSSYYTSLLGLKIPLGLLVRASRAPIVLGFLALAWVPFLVFCHFALLPMLQAAGSSCAGLAVWHALSAVWVTLPLLVTGAVILSAVHGSGPCLAFLTALLGMVCWHAFAIPTLAPTRLGGVLMHLLFAFFEDAPIGVWIWCLVYVVRVQRHVRLSQANRESPFTQSRCSQGSVLIVGNAPTVTDGQPLGSLIDDFGHVVRFNNYSVDRPEYTGSKVSFHFCNGRNFPTSKSVQAVCPLFYSSLTHAVYLFMPHAEDAPDIFASLTSTKVDAWFIEEPQILELRKKINCRFWQIPTSGAVAIDAFLTERRTVPLHGFNFFQGKRMHYFEETPGQLITSWLERFVTHDPSREKRWVEGLLREGRASYLAASPPTRKGGNSAGTEESLASDKAAEGTKREGSMKKEEARRRPGLVKTLLKDGLPSQFSL